MGKALDQAHQGMVSRDVIRFRLQVAVQPRPLVVFHVLENVVAAEVLARHITVS